MRVVWILIIVVGGVAAGTLFTRFEGEAPEIRTRVDQTYVGQEYRHEFTVSDAGMGVESVRVWIEGESGETELFRKTYPGSLFSGARLPTSQRVAVDIKPEELGIKQGRVALVAEARDYSWRGNTQRVSVPITIDTKAPRIGVRTGLTYVRRGGSEAVVYTLNEEAVKHGVQIGEHFSPGFVDPDDPKRFMALYPFPPDTPPSVKPAVIALDRAGNRSQAGISTSVIERSFPSDTITVSDSFLQQKIPEILGGEQDDLVAAYLKVNRDMRKENGDFIKKLCENSSDERLWRGAFLQLPNSNVGARFAERRTYTYNGQEIDRQTHMGYDLASTAMSDIPAANSGVVVFADELGIYGQTVIIDHGQSLFSLYGHLSEITVEKSVVVTQGETIGKTGTTGLAGGDHLHYAMIISGQFVDPLEWFDERWIQEHIEPKLGKEGEAAPGTPASAAEAETRAE